ncbi:MAG: hypothetical protein JSS72_06750 [Armatimonadetes bacterium]|nr:hypothetical protein [Armatimonadota bacterium]
MSFANFVQRRARIQRQRDAKNFSGWIRRITKNQIVLEFVDQPQLARSDVVLVEVHGDDGCASFTAIILETKGNFVILSLLDRFKVLSQSEAPRIKVEGVLGTIRFAGQEHPIAVRDVSAKGIGITTQVVVPHGSTVELEISANKLHLMLQGTIKYCRSLKEGAGFRCGIIVDSSGRIDSARWDSFRKSFTNAA